MLDSQFVGPSFEAGAKPAVFYFALSAKDSLFLDPFNQPVVALQNSDIRVFSITLPGHDHLSPNDAMNYWERESHLLEPFVDKVCAYIQQLIDQKVISKCGVMGLSRGAYIASHVAAKLPSVQTVLGFAPLTKLTYLKKWDLHHLNEKLYSKTIRCYIGNHDIRVGTENTFSWLFGVAETAFTKGIRTSPIELIMTPSIGREGHGTSPEIFKAGAEWLLRSLQ